MTRKILFVCRGNICRSPIAEGVFLHLCRERGLANKYIADSAGTGDWHVGQAPDPRAIAAARKHGVSLPSICRQVELGDFETFDFILAMDRSNFKDLSALCPAKWQSKIKLMRDFDPDFNKKPDVPDPYYGSPEDFDRVSEILLHACSGFLNSLEKEPPSS